MEIEGLRLIRAAKVQGLRLIRARVQGLRLIRAKVQGLRGLRGLGID